MRGSERERDRIWYLCVALTSVIVGDAKWVPSNDFGFGDDEQSKAKRRKSYNGINFAGVTGMEKKKNHLLEKYGKSYKRVEGHELVVGRLALNLKAFNPGGGGDGEVAANDAIKVRGSEGEGLSSTGECNDGDFAAGQFAQLLGFLEETPSSL
ncbi:hypothetical protein AAC387_Pa10g0438 [Persea americana]